MQLLALIWDFSFIRDAFAGDINYTFVVNKHISKVITSRTMMLVESEDLCMK